MTPNYLRHTYASTALALGDDLQAVARHMGHKNTAMIHKVYGHCMPNAADRSRQIMEAAMAESASSPQKVRNPVRVI